MHANTIRFRAVNSHKTDATTPVRLTRDLNSESCMVSLYQSDSSFRRQYESVRHKPPLRRMRKDKATMRSSENNIDTLQNKKTISL